MQNLSYDDGGVRFERDALVTYEGVLRKPGDHGIHCCCSQYSKTVRKCGVRADSERDPVSGRMRLGG